MSKRAGTLYGAAVLAVGLLITMPGPAAAHHRDDHAGGGGSAAKAETSATASATTSSKGCNQNGQQSHHYAADCDGRASENGGGGSTGGAKPCAGCVGSADNKFPPGQTPDEDDHNKGYECDDNGGVGARRGSGNPAHTGCRRPTNEEEPPDDNGGPCDDDPTMPGIQPCDRVLPRPPLTRREVLPPLRPLERAASRLPVTGADVFPWLLVGSVLIALGTGLKLGTRARAAGGRR